jgi:DNA-binding LytR/AlgR family response regulator
MRELHALLAAPRLWAGLAGASLLLGMVGPFGTYDQLPLGGRIAYWAAIAVATYLTGFFVVHFCVRFLFGTALAGLSGFALAGTIAGVPVAGVVTLINRLAFADVSIFGFITVLPYCVAASALVSSVVTFFAREEMTGAASAPPSREQPARPRILDRLPTEKRGRLSHLTMQDHYVEVHTDRGSALVLMRMGDAVAETNGIDGLRIHRSHWVAREAVAGTARRDGRLVLRMRDGAELPVSRSYSGAVRAAGLA